MSLLPDLQKIIGEYTDPNTYQKLIRLYPKTYNWNTYIKQNNSIYLDAIVSGNSGFFNTLLKIISPTSDDLRYIIEYDNIKFFKSLLNRYPDLLEFELFLDAAEFGSYNILSYLIQKYMIDQEQYIELLYKIVELDNLRLLKLIHIKIGLTDEEIDPLINFARIFKYKDIVKFLSGIFES